LTVESLKREVTLLQVVPGAPPQTNGVADFALQIAQALRTNHAVDSIFIVCHPAWDGPAETDGFRFVPARTRTASILQSILLDISRELRGSQPCLLLQLSPYAFSNNGTPFWLVRALEGWKRLARGRLLVYFHELFATSMPWGRAFWLSPLQRKCSRDAARLADFSMTSMQRYVRILQHWDSTRKERHTCLGIPSNIGEPPELKPLAQRKRQVVVFGSPGLRNRAYAASRDFVRVCRMLSIDAIVDIGAGELRALQRIADQGIAIYRHGRIAAHQVSSVLADSQFGYIDYFPGYLAKSGVFAAYCAHGTIPVLPRINHSEIDGISPGHTYWCPELGSPAREQANHLSEQAALWYKPHAVQSHAVRIAAALRGN
jgi:hypothetical protein